MGGRQSSFDLPNAQQPNFSQTLPGRQVSKPSFKGSCYEKIPFDVFFINLTMIVQEWNELITTVEGGLTGHTKKLLYDKMKHTEKTLNAFNTTGILDFSPTTKVTDEKKTPPIPAPKPVNPNTVMKQSQQSVTTDQSEKDNISTEIVDEIKAEDVVTDTATPLVDNDNVCKQIEEDKTYENKGEGERTPPTNVDSVPETNLSTEIKDIENKLEEERMNNSILQSRIGELVKDIDKLKASNIEIKEDRDAVFLRLSKVAGEKLTRDNPSIADLNDKNRPTKLGEMYNELYDNEWTDAFEVLTTAHYSEKESITTLKNTFLFSWSCVDPGSFIWEQDMIHLVNLIIMNVLEFCDKKAHLLIKKTEDAVNLLFEEYTNTAQTGYDKNLPADLTLSKKQRAAAVKALSEYPFRKEDLLLQDKWKPKEKSGQAIVKRMAEAPVHVTVEDKMKVLRKEVAESMVPIVQKAYIDATWDSECIEDLIPFIKKCLYIGWMMVVQSPPLYLHMISGTSNEPFDTAKYRHYTSSGNEVDYVVWPALQLHKDGPIVAKGVAQAKTTE